MSTREEKMEAFGHLLDIMDELREKCPWDRKQTNESLRTNTIEETYELCDAIIRDDNTEIKKELGDLLLHIVFYAKIAEEKEAFDIKGVCDSLCKNLSTVTHMCLAMLRQIQPRRLSRAGSSLN